MNLHDTLQVVRQKAFPRTHALEQELSGLRDEHRRVVEEFAGVREELTTNREQGAQLLAGLQQQITTIDAERQATQNQARLLESSLADAAVRQQQAEQHIKSLEEKLDATRSQYETSVGQTQGTLLQLQAEQQNLLTLQTDTVKTFNEVGKQLLESGQARAERPRQPMLQTAALACLLFLSGALVSGVLLRNQQGSDIDLGGIESGIDELQVLIKSHYDSHDALLKLLTDFLQREEASLGDTSVAGRHDRVDSSGQIIDSLSSDQLAALHLLGFDAGPDVLKKFRSLYLPETVSQPSPKRDEIESVLVYYATLAQADSEKYQVDSVVMAAIRLASLRTGIDFSFLMELASVESNFNPVAKSKTSTATGLYQFKDETWMDAVVIHGSKYGLGSYAKLVEYAADDKGVMRPTIPDTVVSAELLELRTDPRLSALLAAEHVKKNRKQLSTSLEKEPGRTELYLSHFFGANGAISFLQAMAENPEQIARDIFPGPARRNRSVFQNKVRKPRTVAEIYKMFAGKFNTLRFRDSEPG